MLFPEVSADSCVVLEVGVVKCQIGKPETDVKKAHREKPVKMIGKLKETHFQCSPNCYFYFVLSMCLNTEQ